MTKGKILDTIRFLPVYASKNGERVKREDIVLVYSTDASNNSYKIKDAVSSKHYYYSKTVEYIPEFTYFFSQRKNQLATKFPLDLTANPVLPPNWATVYRQGGGVKADLMKMFSESCFHESYSENANITNNNNANNNSPPTQNSNTTSTNDPRSAEHTQGNYNLFQNRKRDFANFQTSTSTNDNNPTLHPIREIDEIASHVVFQSDDQDNNLIFVYPKQANKLHILKKFSADRQFNEVFTIELFSDKSYVILPKQEFAHIPIEHLFKSVFPNFELEKPSVSRQFK